MTSGIVKFIFENKIHKIQNPDSNETILNYIRLKLKKTGTKEGCAEGGCGACTIVLGELKKNNITYKAINSCIAFVPSLEGKQLLIVEDLISKNGSLHPVQNAMVKYHGSQCGFCTPGFVMSLFAMYKNYSSYDDKLIKDTIAGNLCRCTGYRPIIDAAISLNNQNQLDQFKKIKKNTISLLKKIKQKNISIKNFDKKYFAPRSIIELKKVIKKYPNSKLLSGGTPSTMITEYWNGDIPWTKGAVLTTNNTTKGEKFISELGLKNSSTSIISKDNLLVVSRVSIGNISINKIDVAINQDITAVILNKTICLTDFLYWNLLQTINILVSFSQGTTIQGFTRKDLSSHKVLLPSLPEQQKIASILSNMDSKITSQEQYKEKLEKLKKSLMQKLLTGEVRV